MLLLPHWGAPTVPFPPIIVVFTYATFNETQIPSEPPCNASISIKELVKHALIMAEAARVGLAQPVARLGHLSGVRGLPMPNASIKMEESEGIEPPYAGFSDIHWFSGPAPLPLGQLSKLEDQSGLEPDKKSFAGSRFVHFSI